MSETFKKFKVPIIIGLSFALWVFLFRDFFFAKIKLFPDGYAYYAMTKYYLDAMLRGVFPLWQPLDALGMPDTLNLRFLGEFNPFLFIPAVLYRLGAGFNVAYFIYAIGYYFLGALGFYLLSKRFFQDTTLALVSFILLLFSCTSIPIFFNYCEVSLLVPSIWFFYFLYAFLEAPNKKDFLGMTFSLMIVMITYMPFYFITVFFALIAGFLVFDFRVITKSIRTFTDFIGAHKTLGLFCLVAAAVSAIPGFLWYLDAGSGDFTIPYRQSGTQGNASMLSFDMISLGTIVGPLTFKKLFSGFSYQLNELSYFFASVFVFPIILLSIINRLNKRLIVLFFVAFMMFLISLTDITPVYKLFYEHGVYFKLIRNMYYVLYLAIPFIVLFVVEQLRLILQWDPKTRRERIALSVFIVVVHAGFVFFLHNLGEIITTTYITVSLSCFFFLLFAWKVIKRGSNALLAALLVLAVMQPVEVYSFYCINGRKETKGYSYQTKMKAPYFSFTRPRKGEDAFFGEGRMAEGPGIPFVEYSGPGGTHALIENIPLQLFQEYVRHKFVVYDRILPLDFQNMTWEELGFALYQKINVAFIDREQFDPADQMQRKGSSKAEYITGNTDEFEVMDFDLNFIRFRTNFDQKKFIVYNDSFYKGWHARIDDEPVKIYRANVAFKGVWVPQGEHIVYMRFGPAWVYVLNFGLLIFFSGFFIYFLRECCRRDV